MAKWRPIPRVSGRAPWSVIQDKYEPFSTQRPGEWWNVQRGVQAYWDRWSTDCSRSCFQKGYWRQLQQRCNTVASRVADYERLYASFRKCYSARDLAKLPGVVREHLHVARPGQTDEEYAAEDKRGRIGAAVCWTGGGPLAREAHDRVPSCELLVVRDNGSCDEVGERFGRAPSYLHGPLRAALHDDLVALRERELPRFLKSLPHRPELHPLLAETAGYSRAWRKSWSRTTVARPEALSPEDQAKRKALWAEAYRWYLDQGLTQKQILSLFARVWKAERDADRANWEAITRRERRENALHAAQHRRMLQRAEALMREFKLGRGLDRKQRRFVLQRWASEMRFRPDFKPPADWFDPKAVAAQLAPPRQRATRSRPVEDDGGEED